MVAWCTSQECRSNEVSGRQISFCLRNVFTGLILLSHIRIYCPRNTRKDAKSILVFFACLAGPKVICLSRNSKAFEIHSRVFLFPPPQRAVGARILLVDEAQSSAFSGLPPKFFTSFSIALIRLWDHSFPKGCTTWPNFDRLGKA